MQLAGRPRRKYVSNCRSSTTGPPRISSARIGERLVGEFYYLEQPAFRYTFDVVNLKINAFALPGGPMFLHRGMIEAALPTPEVVVLTGDEFESRRSAARHGAGDQGQKFQIGAIAGQVLGAIVGDALAASSRKDRKSASVSIS